MDLLLIVLVLIFGLLMFALGKDKVASIGLVMFAVGLFFTLQNGQRFVALFASLK